LGTLERGFLSLRDPALWAGPPRRVVARVETPDHAHSGRATPTWVVEKRGVKNSRNPPDGGGVSEDGSPLGGGRTIWE